MAERAPKRLLIRGGRLLDRAGERVGDVLVESGAVAAVVLVGPATLLPASAASWGVEQSARFDEVVAELDVCYLLRLQSERGTGSFLPSVREYRDAYGLSVRRAALLPEDALVMHPGPMNRGVEIADDVAELPRSVVLQQVANGVAVRMAVLFLLLGRPSGSDVMTLEPAPEAVDG